MPTIADYYVQIMPSAEGMKGELTKIMDDEAGSAGDKASGTFGSKFSAGVKTAAAVGAAAIGAATTAVSGFAASSVSAGMNFDSSMSQVAATMGTTVDQIQDLRDFAQEMGSTTAFSATEAADALNYMALAGYDADTSMQMLPNVLNLASAGGIDLASASDMVTDAQSALGLTMEETSAMVDQMAAASSKSNTSVSQLGEAILTIGATASNMAGGTQELSTVLGALADNGIKGAEGGTHLRNMLLSLQNPTEQASATLDELGIAVYDSEGNMRSMIDIVGELQTATADMDQQSKDAVVSGIFNKTDLAAVNALLNTSTERFDELGSAIEDSQGAAQAMADTQLDNLSGDITLFKSALEGAQIAVSDQLTPSLREFVQFGSNGLSELTAAFQEGGISGAMSAFGDILADLVGMIGEKLPDIVNAGTELLGSLVEGIIQNLPTLATAAMEIITNLATGLAQNLPTLIPTITEILLQVTTIIIENLPTIIEAGMQLFQGLVEGLVAAIPVIVDALPGLIDTIISTLIESMPLIMDGALTMFMAIVDALPDIISAITEALPQIIDSIVSFLTSDGLPQILEGAITMLMGIVEAIPSIISAIASNLPTIITTIITGLVGALPQILSAAVSMLNGIIDAIPEIISSLASNIPTIIDAIVTSLSAGLSAIKTVGVNLISGLWNGISDKAQWLYSQITNLGNTVVSKVKSLFGINSPSKVFAEIGGYLAEGLGEGWNDEITDVKNDISKDLAFKGTLETNYSTTPSSNNALVGTSFTMYETIQLGDTKLKEIVSKYTIQQVGNETRAVKVAQGGYY